MLGQEVEDEELLDALEPPSPIPVEIITVSQDTLPPAGKGILVTEGFGSRPPSEKKEVKFADGICPGEGTSTSGGEASPPPKPRLPKEKRFKKKKTKLKKKVKVRFNTSAKFHYFLLNRFKITFKNGMDGSYIS